MKSPILFTTFSAVTLFCLWAAARRLQARDIQGVGIFLYCAVACGFTGSLCL